MAEKETEPQLAYQAVQRYKGLKEYADGISKAVRQINYMSGDELKEAGVALGNAESVWSYANKLAEKALSGVKLDPTDSKYKGNYNQIKTIVQRLSNKPDLLEAVLGAYVNTASSYTDENVALSFQTAQTKYAKPQLRLLSKAAGVESEYKKQKEGVKDPNDAGTLAGQLAGQLREKVSSGVATSSIGNLEDIVTPKAA